MVARTGLQVWQEEEVTEEEAGNECNTRLYFQSLQSYVRLYTIHLNSINYTFTQ